MSDRRLAWLRGHVDIVTAVVLVAATAAALPAADPLDSTAAWTAAIAALAFPALIAAGGRSPIAVAALGGILLAIPVFLGEENAVSSAALEGPGVIALFVIAYRLGSRCRWTVALLGLVPLNAGLALSAGGLRPWQDFNPLAEIATVGPWLAGLLVASYRQVEAQLEQRARELEDERELFAVQSVRYERARIARELHDIVAHCVSLIVVQASAGEHLATADPASAAEAFASISDVAGQADVEIARLVALLDPSEPRGPVTARYVIDELVARVRASGLQVACQFGGDVDGLPGPVGETTYRLVQEAVTNALKHAPGAPISISIRADTDAVRLEVSNEEAARVSVAALRAAGGHHGVAGMRDRVARHGGTFRAGPTAERGWHVSVCLPRLALARTEESA